MKVEQFQKYEKFLVPCILFIIISILTYPYFSVGFVIDSLQGITASKLQDSWSLEYWLKIFTQPHYREQYRPLSLFAYFFWLREILGTNPILFRFVFIIIFSTLSSLMYIYLKNFLDKISSFTAVMLFITSATNFYWIYEISNHLKYYGPLVFLLIALLTSLNGLKKNSQILIVLTCLILSIFCHEASSIFSLVIFLYLYFFKKKITKKHFIILLPLFVLGITRVFIWRVPTSGEFSVGGFSLFPVKVMYYLTSSYLGFLDRFRPIAEFSGDSWGIYLISCFTIFTGALFYVKKTRKMDILFFLFSSILVILPFASLQTHIAYDRSIWSVFFSSIFLMILVMKFMPPHVAKYSKSLLVIISFILCIRSYLRADNARVAPKVEIIKSELFQKIKELQREGLYSIVLTENERSDIIYGLVVVPGLMALEFPAEELHLHLQRGSNKKIIIVKNGGYYFYKGMNAGGELIVEDAFQVKTNLEHLEVKALTEIHHHYKLP